MLSLGRIALAVVVLASIGCDAPPGEPAGPLTLTLFDSARAADEVVLEWTPDPRAERWQYRLKDLRDWRWTEWQDIPDSNFRTTSHRVGGLLPRHIYRFQVRPWTGAGPGEPSAYPDLPNQLGREVTGKIETVGGVDALTWTHLLERGGTFRLHEGSPYTFTVPERGLWDMGGSSLTNVDPDNPDWLHIDPHTGRWLFENPGGRPETHYLAFTDVEPGEGAERILASIRYVPVHPDPPLRALVGGGTGEVLLQWKSPPQAKGAQRWQYRQRRVPGWTSGGEWSGGWTDVPGSDGATRSYRLDGVESDPVTYEFQVRPWLRWGPGAAYTSDRISLPRQGYNRTGIPWAMGVLEPGRTFLVDNYPIEITFETPEGMFLRVTRGRLHRDPDVDWVGDYDGLWRSVVLLDVASGSYLLLNQNSGEYIERYIRPDPTGRDVDALFDQIIASTRRVPLTPPAPVRAERSQP